MSTSHGVPAAASVPSLPLMVVAAAVAGAGQGACRPAYQALIAEVVDEPQRQQANAALTLSIRGTILVSLMLTAVLATVLDTVVLLFGVGVFWLVAALLPPAGAPVSRADTAHARFVAEFVEGVREARRHPWFLSGLGALTAVIFTGYSATGVALPLISRDRYGTEAVLAAAMTASTLGALAGALVIGRWRPRNQGWVALTGLGVYGFAPLSLMFPVHPGVVIAAYVLVGFGIEVFNVPWFTATQREVAPDKMARVSSLDFLASYGLAPVGLALIGPAIDAVGVTAVLGACALVTLVAPAVAAVTPTARHFSRRFAKSATEG